MWIIASHVHSEQGCACNVMKNTLSCQMDHALYATMNAMGVKERRIIVLNALLVFIIIWMGHATSGILDVRFYQMRLIQNAGIVKRFMVTMKIKNVSLAVTKTV